MFNGNRRRWRARIWLEELEKYVYSKSAPLGGWRYGLSEDEAVRGEGFDDSKWPLAREGGRIGKVDQFVWLRNEVTIPEEFTGGEVHVFLDAGQTGVLFLDGAETVGLDTAHKEVTLAKRARAGASYRIAAEVYTGPVERFTIVEFGNPREWLAAPFFRKSELRLVNRDGFRLYYDFLVAVDLLDGTAAGSREGDEILAAISECINAIELSADEKARNASFRAASRILSERLFAGQKGDASGEVALIGQSHIDMAWLWPRRETIRKCAATMASTLNLMGTYPFFRFSHSQAQGFQWLKDHYPKLYARMRREVKKGRIELLGGMWVEADLNCTSGEALARQFLYGQKFFEKEFGHKCRVGWLVDTFGYTWALPQILRESGLEFFVSTKPTWNDTNVFPFTNFRWEGPDGSQVLTHVPTVSYGADIGVKKIGDTLEKHKEARLGVPPAALFGKSDGGGGATTKDLESIPRLAASPYAPKLTVKQVEEYFADLPRDADYPVYCDEMYVEYHRGTYTTQARTKKNNRKAECALYSAEVAASAAAMLGAKWPAGDFERAWKLALFNQFHDILPGTSVAPVYDDAERDYAEVFEATEALSGEALRFIAEKVDTTGPGRAVLVFNPLPRERTDIVEIDAGRKACRVTDFDGSELAWQRVAGRPSVVAALVTVPACGWKVVRIVGGRGGEQEALSRVEGRHIETPLLSAKLNAAGQLESIFDKGAGREALLKGQAGNRLQLIEDITVEYEAWDMEEWADEKMREVDRLESFKVIENGPVRTVARLVWKAGASTFTQRMVLYGHTRRIDFETKVDWQERKTLLKAAFPVAARSRRATYEIAFGAIERSTQQSNPWEWARFEVPAQKWADLSQADFGASILNDCKYGYDARGSVLRISLLRSPECPDPGADRGTQEFTYSFYPHRGDWRAGRTVEEAHELNLPLICLPVKSTEGAPGGEGWFFDVEARDGAPVVLSALKRSEDGKGYIARIYEPHGRQAKVVLSVPFEIAEAESVNFLEERQAALRHGRRSATVELGPWKVASVKLTPK